MAMTRRTFFLVAASTTAIMQMVPEQVEVQSRNAEGRIEHRQMREAERQRVETDEAAGEKRPSHVPTSRTAAAANVVRSCSGACPRRSELQGGFQHTPYWSGEAVLGTHFSSGKW